MAMVYEVTGDHSFSGADDDFLELGHDPALALTNGTYAMHFNASNVSGAHALFAKDGAGYQDGGHLKVYIQDGILKVRMQSTYQSKYIEVESVPIAAGEDHHLAVSFGDDGLLVFVDGDLVAAEPTFKQSMADNDDSLLLGASNANRHEGSTSADLEFEGTISDVKVYDEQLSAIDVALISGPAFSADVLHALEIEDLMPAFSQLHHATDALKAIAMDVGYMHDGTIPTTPVDVGTNGADAMNGDADANLMNGKMGNDTIDGGDGADQIQGGYGNDDLFGGAGNDVLDGGHGEDILYGGDGNDVLISQADGREGFITFDPSRDEGDPYGEIDPVTGKLYPNQPIPADDVLVGGGGADIFYIQTLINAKARFIEKHTNDDGTIRWHGVAGENNSLHDHWVDVIGNDIIADFSRAEGDKIIIEGHTTEVLDIDYKDSDGDGILDYTLISLYSDQGGGGGAHNNDLLGTISVYGDLVREGDYTQTAAPAYGIVKSIDKFDEAVAPLDDGSERPGDFSAPGAPDYSHAGANPVIGVQGEVLFDGSEKEPVVIYHKPTMALSEGTFSLTFNPNSTTDTWQALFTKDGSDFQDGGHVAAYLDDGDLWLRLQSVDGERKIVVEDVVQAGVDQHLALSFGADGFKAYLNGTLIGHISDFTQNLLTNMQPLIVGASNYAAPQNDPDRTKDYFDGTIDDFLLYGEQFSDAQIVDLAAKSVDVSAGMVPDVLNLIGGAGAQELIGSDSDNFMDGGTGHDTLIGEGGADTMLGGDSGADKMYGGDGNDSMDGGTGHDSMRGGNDNDTLLGGASGEDTLFGESGDDYLDGGSNHDDLYGDSGNDTLLGGISGQDYLRGGSGNDYLDGGTGHDTVKGDSGNDTLLGGESGNDTLYGGDGDDLLIGGSGSDRMHGGAGADSFIYLDMFDSTINSHDHILDFTQGEDRIDLSAIAALDEFADITVTIMSGYTDVSANAGALLFELSGEIALTDADFIWT